METLKNLLVATDASPESEETIAYALGMSKDLGANLTIMLCYDPSDQNAKEETKERFEHLEAHLLHGKPVHYHLASSDQPVPQTLTEMSGIYHPEILITHLPDATSLEELIEKTRHPLLLLPPKVLYQKIQHMAVAYDASVLPQEESFTFISQLARHYQAFVHILELNHNTSFTDRYNSRANWEADYLLKDVKHRFHFLKNQDITAGIQKFLTRHATDLLVVLSRRQLPEEEHPLERHTIKMARLIPRPLMIFKV